MARPARQASTESERGAASEIRALSATVSRIRAVVRQLNRIATRMDRTLGTRLRRLEALRQ